MPTTAHNTRFELCQALCNCENNHILSNLPPCYVWQLTALNLCWAWKQSPKKSGKIQIQRESGPVLSGCQLTKHPWLITVCVSDFSMNIYTVLVVVLKKRLLCNEFSGNQQEIKCLLPKLFAAISACAQLGLCGVKSMSAFNLRKKKQTKKKYTRALFHIKDKPAFSVLCKPVLIPFTWPSGTVAQFWLTETTKSDLKLTDHCATIVREGLVQK